MIKKVQNSKIGLLTFDYELFFQKTGTVDNCILKPVDILIDYFNRHNIKATFFIDALYYMRTLDNPETREQSYLIKQQLQSLVANGHRIELHLHPHWLDAKYSHGEWAFPTYRYYRLQNLAEERVIDLFVNGTQIINEIAGEIIKDYKAVAFRAGGWCVQPFNKLRQGFKKSGIIIDSSVAAGIKGQSTVHFFDFLEAPNLSCYKFSDDPTILDEKGQFYEIPITSFRMGFFDKIHRKIYFLKDKNNFRTYGDGAGIPIYREILDKIHFTYEMLTIEGMAPSVLERILLNSQCDVMNFISHPKGLSQASLQCLDVLCNHSMNFLTLDEYVMYMNNEGVLF